MQEESPEGGRFKKEVVVDGQSYLLLIRDEGGPPELQVIHSFQTAYLQPRAWMRREYAENPGSMCLVKACQPCLTHCTERYEKLKVIA